MWDPAVVFYYPGVQSLFQKWKPSLQSMSSSVPLAWSMDSLSAEFLGLEEFTSILAICQKIVANQMTVSHIGHLSVMCSCQFPSMWRGWSLFHEGAGAPRTAWMGLCVILAGPSCLGTFCALSYVALAVEALKLVGHRCERFVGNGSLFLINLMILVTIFDYISSCSVL